MTTTKELRPDQVEAVAKLTAALSQTGTDRCQYVAACATGKTLVSQRVSEALVPDGLIVVAVPTIALLSQTLHAWLGDATPGAEFSYLAICSDPEVEAKALSVSRSDEVTEDEVAEEEHLRDEFDGAVCIKLDDIKARTKTALNTGRTVAFSTHASIGRLGQALDELGESANLLIVDEAHRAAAVHPEAERDGSACLGKVVTGTFPAARRLFATATPLIIHIDHNRSARGREDEVVRYSMDDDPAGPFGAVAYRLGFAEAVELGLLVPYEVVVQITSSDETAQALATRQLLDMGGERIPADRLATYSGVARAAHQHDLRHVLTFHERVSSAEEFAKDLGVVAHWLYPDESVRVDSVSAKHATHERDAKFHAFAPEAFPAPNGHTPEEPADRAFLSNVRICTEGIDIKAIDGVAFVDPCQSVVNIAQAVGRAMRRWTDPTTRQEKEQGVVIVPVVVPPGTTVEEHMASTGWKTVQGVLEALCAVDDRLQGMLTTSLVRRGTTRDSPAVPVTCPKCENILLRSDSSCPWCDPEPVVALAAGNESHGGTVECGDENDSAPATGNGDVSADVGTPGYTEPPGQPLSSAPRLVIAGDASEFISTISLSVLRHSVATFDANVIALAQWVAANGRLPLTGNPEDPTERRLGQFLSHCRTAARGGKYARAFTPRRRAMLDKHIPGWEGPNREAIFDANVIALGQWVTASGRLPRVSVANDPTERRLGSFLSDCRKASKSKETSARAFTPRRRAMLDKCVPGWEGISPEDAFDANVIALAEWVKATGGLPSQSSKDPAARRLRQFLSGCRKASNGKGNGARAFTPRRRAMLDKYVPTWKGIDPEDAFDANVIALAEWTKTNGRLPVTGTPNDSTERRLGYFLSHYRAAARGGQCASAFTPHRRAMLDEHVPGWEGTDPEDAFDANVIALGQWVKTNGHLPSSGATDPAECRLGQFLITCRMTSNGKGAHANTFTPRRRAMLDKHVPGWDIGREATFDANVIALAEWVKTNGRLPPQSSKDPMGRRLGQFLSGCRMASSDKGAGAKAFTPRRRAMLDKHVPGWEGTNPEDAFDANVIALSRWVKGNERLPLMNGATDPAEYRLGSFLGDCRKASNGKGTSARAFTPRRRAMLDKHVPSWNTDREATFDANVMALGEWTKTNGRLPSSGAKAPVERRLGVFLCNSAAAARGGKYARAFTPRRRAMLDTHVPGWDNPRRRPRRRT